MKIENNKAKLRKKINKKIKKKNYFMQSEIWKF
jgi:hypothetical protein